MSHAELTIDEQFVLAWLSETDRGGLYGECKGTRLATLVAKGLAELPEPLDDEGYVILTQAGRRALAELERRHGG